MRHIKRLSLDSKNPSSDKFSVSTDQRIITNLTGGMELPSGSAAERPTMAGSDFSGTMRFNSTTNEIEVYNYNNPGPSRWESIRTIRQATITPQNLGTGNYSDYIFGPLSYDIDPTKPQNILVFIDNVYQAPTTNYTLISTPAASTATLTYTTASGATTLYLSTVTNIDSTDNNGGWRTVSAPMGIQLGTTVTSVSTTFSIAFQGYPVGISLPTNNTINSNTTITLSYTSGTYIQFTGAVPAKPVFALLGFDGYWV